MDKLFNLGNLALISACLLTSCAFGENSEKLNFDPNKITIRDITVNTRDNLNIAVQFYAPQSQEKLPAVLLLHMLGKDKSSWNKFIPTLLDNGFAVYNADLRGHGRSVRMQNGHEVFYQNMNETDWKKISDDITDLVNFISQDKSIDSKNIGIIGASIGANSAIMVAADHPDKIKTIVALSPGLNYHGLETLNPAKNLKIPALMAVSSGDEYSYQSSNQLNEVVKTRHDLLIYNGNEHGTSLLDKSEDLQRKIINWLNEYLKK